MFLGPEKQDDGMMTVNVVEGGNGLEFVARLACFSATFLLDGGVLSFEPDRRARFRPFEGEPNHVWGRQNEEAPFRQLNVIEH